MLSYISKTVSKAYKASRKVLKVDNPAYKETQQYKLIRKLQKYGSEVLPGALLTELSTLSYDLEQFYLIFDILAMKLDNYGFDSESKAKQKQFRNTLIICAFLIKNGASGFIDQFRNKLDIIEKISSRNSYPLLFTYYKDEKMADFVEKNIMCRALYLQQLLKDKSKLAMEKQIAMLVKQKLKLKQKDGQNDKEISEKTKSDNQKVQSFLQTYVWKYIGLIDQKLDNVADVLATQVEKYLLEEIPESFQIDEIDEKQEVPVKTQFDFSEKKMKEEEKFVTSKYKVKEQVNLLQL